MLSRLRSWLARVYLAPADDAAAPPALESSGPHVASAVYLPPLPGRYAGVARVLSESDPGRGYDVDLVALTCTCPDFRKHRQHLAPLHVGRICKHLSAELQESGAIEEYDDLRQAIVRVGRAKPEYRHRRLPSGTEVVYGFSHDSPWLDVFVQEAGGFTRYGYNREEGRWSYSEEPDEAHDIGLLARVVHGL